MMDEEQEIIFIVLLVIVGLALLVAAGVVLFSRLFQYSYYDEIRDQGYFCGWYGGSDYDCPYYIVYDENLQVDRKSRLYKMRREWLFGWFCGTIDRERYYVYPD